jgi:hypothetical protein
MTEEEKQAVIREYQHKQLINSLQQGVSQCVLYSALLFILGVLMIIVLIGLDITHTKIGPLEKEVSPETYMACLIPLGGSLLFYILMILEKHIVRINVKTPEKEDGSEVW